MPQNSADSVSLNKYISDTGFCSRREADSYVEDGRVTINGRPARTGNRVNAGDLVEVDGEPLGRKRAPVYLAYNKPAGVTSTTDPKDQTNIVRAIDFKERIFPVGRLDKDSEGLIFLTNDGSIVNRILRAGNAHEKEYVVGVDQPVTAEFIKAMSSGVRISSDETTLPCKVVAEGKNGFRITLVQGLNRQIRRMCATLGFGVTRLRRVRIMNMHLGNLPLGHWRYFNAEETATLQLMIQGSSDDAAPGAARKPAARARKVVSKPAAPEDGAAKPKSRSAQEYRDERKAKTEAIKKQSREANKAGNAAKAAGKRPGAPGGKAAPGAGRRGAAKAGSFKDFRSKRGRKG